MSCCILHLAIWKQSSKVVPHRTYHKVGTGNKVALVPDSMLMTPLSQRQLTRALITRVPDAATQDIQHSMGASLKASNNFKQQAQGAVLSCTIAKPTRRPGTLPLTCTSQFLTVWACSAFDVHVAATALHVQ